MLICFFFRNKSCIDTTEKYGLIKEKTTNACNKPHRKTFELKFYISFGQSLVIQQHVKRSTVIVFLRKVKPVFDVLRCIRKQKIPFSLIFLSLEMDVSPNKNLLLLVCIVILFVGM